MMTRGVPIAVRLLEFANDSRAVRKVARVAIEEKMLGRSSTSTTVLRVGKGLAFLIGEDFEGPAIEGANVNGEVVLARDKKAGNCFVRESGKAYVVNSMQYWVS